MTTVKMSLLGSSLGGGIIQTEYSGNVTPGPDNTVTVDTRDVPSMLRLGASYVNQMNRWQPISAARAGSAGRIVASATLANGTLAIANQPDVGRVCNVRVDPSTLAITAGVIALNYTANDGTTQTDTLPLSVALSTLLTQPTSKGVLHLNSAIVTGLVGGATPKVQIDDTNSLALQVDAGFQSFAVTKANVDGADEVIGTVNAAAGSITPTTAPNATHTYGFAYTYLGVST